MINSITSIVTVTNSKLLLHWSHNDTNDSSVLQGYIKDIAEHVKTEKRPKMEFKVHVLDNSPLHTAHIVRNQVKHEKMRALFLPPYSPEYNPTEKYFMYQKSLIRSAMSSGR